MTIKTPEQIAAEVVQATYGPEAGASAHATMSRVLDERDEYTAADIFDLMHAAIEADRTQRAEALDALHAWAVNVSYLMGTDKSNDWSEDLAELAKIERKNGLGGYA